MRTGTARRLRVLKRIVVAGMLVGIAYDIVLHLVAYNATFVDVVTGALIGAIHGLLISSAIGALEIFGIRTRLGQSVEGAPFVVTLGVKGTVYGAIVAIVNVVEPGTRAVGLSPAVGRMQMVAVIFSVVVTTAFLFILQISRIVGGRTLQNWVLGRYHDLVPSSGSSRHRCRGVHSSRGASRAGRGPSVSESGLLAGLGPNR